MDLQKLFFNENSIKEKIFSLDSQSVISIQDDFFTTSAVLFTLVPHEQKPYELVLIHRANKGSCHRGEMSFPGGKFDPKLDNSLKDTALRECEEEIGVPRDEIKIIGRLNDFPTMTQFIISPFIGVINKEQELVRDQREVQEIIKVPINFFIEKQNFRETAMDFGGKPFPVFFFNYEVNHKNYMIWGATAFMIVNFIEMVYNHAISDLGLRRFTLEEIKPLKDYILSREEFDHHLENHK